MINAIVYSSNTGFTAQYAELISKRIGLPAHEFSEAKHTLREGTRIIYLGWLKAGKIVGLNKAAKLFNVRAVCGVGIAPTGSMLSEVRKVNSLPEYLPVFTLQGGLNMSKLHGINKLALSAVSKTLIKTLSENENRTSEENDTLEMLLHGGSCVSVDNLLDLFNWYTEMVTPI